ncbi:unnamed protein product [Adineta steineri]|uniref:Uncharacterized protein n=1 Tax=Adineta steineri TaxID=433720 RepID=A0A816BUR1_9BILA|nr:unnamed protein product [Adineta steineri]CAF1613087.1 unnamed protein product [Adineta steineri]
MRIHTLLIIWILLLFTIIHGNTSKQSKNKANKLIQNRCDKLYGEDLSLTENRQWKYFCEKWITSARHHQQQRQQQRSKSIVDESHKRKFHKPRSFRSRRSRKNSHTYSRSSSSSRTSSFVSRYRNIRTGAIVSRPTGWLWSRTRHVFLPISRSYYYRSSSNRYTTPTTNSQSYYYCTSNSSNSIEIQCNTINNDSQCCEDETAHQVFCCGGEIDADYIADLSQATKRLSQLFYTLSAIALFMHLFMKRLYQ